MDKGKLSSIFSKADIFFYIVGATGILLFYGGVFLDFVRLGVWAFASTGESVRLDGLVMIAVSLPLMFAHSIYLALSE